MKIIGISDTHCQHRKLKIPEGDILVHGGDSLSYGTVEEFNDFLDWYDSLPFQHLLYTPGNHDWFTYNNTELAKKMCSDRGITMLVDEEITINGIRIYMTSWTPEFCGWAWMRQDHEAESVDGEEGLGKYFTQIPEGLDILISHGPPFGYLDKAPSNKTHGVGSQELLKAIMRAKPKLVLVGHIHEGSKQGDGEGNDYIYHEDGQVTHIANISVLDGRYRLGQKPRVFEL